MEREREAYTEATSGGGDRGGSGYFSSMRPTMTSESGIHLSSNLITGTFPSGFSSKNLNNHHHSKKSHFFSLSQTKSNPNMILWTKKNAQNCKGFSNHWGLSLRLTRLTLYGIFFSSKVSWTLWQKGPKNQEIINVINHNPFAKKSFWLYKHVHMAYMCG